MTIQTWCMKKLNTGPYTATPIGSHGMLVKRHRGGDVVAYCPDSASVPFNLLEFEAALIEVAHVKALVIVNRPLGAGVFEAAMSRGILVASFGHFERALDLTNISEFVHPEEAYLRSRLGQRPEVTHVTRIGLRAWKIDRASGLRPLVIVTHDRYEFTDDEMWQLVAQSPGIEVDAFVVTNPNTSGFGNRVVTSAAGLGIVICTTNEFLRLIGEPWS